VTIGVTLPDGSSSELEDVVSLVCLAVSVALRLIGALLRDNRIGTSIRQESKQEISDDIVLGGHEAVVTRNNVRSKDEKEYDGISCGVLLGWIEIFRSPKKAASAL